MPSTIDAFFTLMKKMHYVKDVQPPWIFPILNGDKKIEGRCCKGVFQDMKPGDTVTWFNTLDTYQRIVCVITQVKRYPTFREYLIREGVDNCLPGLETHGNDTLERALAVYLRSPESPHGYFLPEQERRLWRVCCSL